MEVFSLINLSLQGWYLSHSQLYHLSLNLTRQSLSTPVAGVSSPSWKRGRIFGFELTLQRTRLYYKVLRPCNRHCCWLQDFPVLILVSKETMPGHLSLCALVISFFSVSVFFPLWFLNLFVKCSFIWHIHLKLLTYCKFPENRCWGVTRKTMTMVYAQNLRY